MMFEIYIRTGKVKRKTPDPEEARALLKQAGERMDYVDTKEINETSAKFVLEGGYEAIREAAQGLMSCKGYKPYSHEATIEFVKEFHDRDFSGEDIALFEHFRKLRNDSVYRAVQITAEDARDCLAFARRFVGKAQKITPKP